MKSLTHGDRKVSTFVLIFVLVSTLIAGLLLIGTGLGTYNARAGNLSDLKYCNSVKSYCSGKNARNSNCSKFRSKCLKPLPTAKPTPPKKKRPSPTPAPKVTYPPTPTVVPTVKYPPTPTAAPTPTPSPTPTLLPTPAI